MKALALALILTSAPMAMAQHETDRAQVTPAQIEAAKALPGTTVFRVSRSNPNQVEVAHLPQKLTAEAPMNGVTFQQVAANAEVVGQAFTAANELDKTSSTSSWRFGYGYGYGRGYGYGYGYGRGYYAGYYGGGCNYGYGCGYTGYGYNQYWAYPAYSYVGYNYYYRPYYSYVDPNYYYVYCGWGY